MTDKEWLDILLKAPCCFWCGLPPCMLCGGDHGDPDASPARDREWREGARLEQKALHTRLAAVVQRLLDRRTRMAQDRIAFDPTIKSDLIHLAGEPVNGFQRCDRCGLVMAEPGFMKWPTGPIRCIEMRSGPRQWTLAGEPPWDTPECPALKVLDCSGGGA